MFLGEVLVGDHIDLPSQRDLKKPPNKDDGTEYDSVRGHTQNSDVYMVYSNKKCYPKYMVFY